MTDKSMKHAATRTKRHPRFINPRQVNIVPVPRSPPLPSGLLCSQSSASGSEPRELITQYVGSNCSRERM